MPIGNIEQREPVVEKVINDNSVTNLQRFNSLATNNGLYGGLTRSGLSSGFIIINDTGKTFITIDTRGLQNLSTPSTVSELLELIENPALSEESVITTETANSISQKESLYLNLGFQSEHVSYVLKLLREDILVMFITNRDLGSYNPN